MKLFQQRDLKDAYAYAASGGQALLLLKTSDSDIPRARMIDHDYDRLFATVRWLGLKAVIPDRIGQEGQSIVIRGRQLSRALAECATLELAL